MSDMLSSQLPKNKQTHQEKIFRNSRTCDLPLLYKNNAQMGPLVEESSGQVCVKAGKNLLEDPVVCVPVCFVLILLSTLVRLANQHSWQNHQNVEHFNFQLLVNVISRFTIVCFIITPKVIFLCLVMWSGLPLIELRVVHLAIETLEVVFGTVLIAKESTCMIVEELHVCGKQCLRLLTDKHLWIKYGYLSRNREEWNRCIADLWLFLIFKKLFCFVRVAVQPYCFCARFNWNLQSYN